MNIFPKTKHRITWWNSLSEKQQRLRTAIYCKEVKLRAYKKAKSINNSEDVESFYSDKIRKLKKDIVLLRHRLVYERTLTYNDMSYPICYCGALLSTSYKYCPKCGMRLKIVLAKED